MPEPDPEANEEENVEVKKHTRQKKGRKPFPDTLPRVEIIHDIDEQKKICHCGAELSRIGEGFWKARYHPIYYLGRSPYQAQISCKQCENAAEIGPTVKIAPVPVQLIPKSIASGGLMAHILTPKFVDSLPFYRQERQFNRLDADIPRASMCRWAMRGAEACISLKDLLRQDILSGPLINADETTVQVLKEPSLDEKTGVTHLGCLAHARRKFMKAKKARGKNSKKTGGPDVALQFIKDLYRLERGAKKQNLSTEEFFELRQEKAKPILDKMHAWLMEKSMHLVPKSLLGKGVVYTLNGWERLKSYIDFPFATPDNNLAENAIRPFCVVRKNWIFAGTPGGAEASATIFSLVETAKVTGLEPYKYLRYLFGLHPFAQTENDDKQLIPGNLTPEILESVPKVSSV